MRALTLIMLLAAPAWADTFTGKVTGVADPETLVVEHGGRQDAVTLAGIRAPRDGEKGYDQAKAFVVSFALLHLVTVDARADAATLRGDVRLTDRRSLREALVEKGFARWDEQAEPANDVLKDLEKTARREKRGLWAVEGAFSAAPVSVEAPHRLILRAGETAVYTPAGAVVELISLSDSRCPQGVQCVWSGEISALLRVTRPGFPPAEVSTGWLGGAHPPAEQAGLLFRFSNIVPAPGPAGQAFNPAQHIVFIDVSAR